MAAARVGRGARGPTAGRAVLAGAAAVALIAAILVSLAANLALQGQTRLAERLVPSAAAILDRRVQEALIAHGDRLPPALRQEAREVLAHEPQAAGPFTIFAFDALARGDAAGAVRFGDAAVARDPRSAPARLARAIGRLRGNAPARAIEDFDRVLAIAPQAWQQLVPLLATMTVDPSVRAALAPVLRRNPAWRNPLLGEMIRRGDDPGMVFALMRASAPPGSDLSSEQGALLNAIVAGGDYQRAYLAWINFLPDDALAAVANVYDGGFRGRPGPPPFNWRFTSDAEGRAEIETPGALDASFGGRVALRLAEQLLVLAPGRYGVAVDVASGDAPRDATNLVWRIACIDGRPLGELAVGGVGPAPVRRAGRFAVPAGCAAQRLSLEGVVADFPSSGRTRFTNLAIEPLR